MGCNCSSDYSDSEWIENLDEICEHCNCPIPPQSCNPVSVYGHFVCAGMYLCQYIVHCSVWMSLCVSEFDMNGFWLLVWLNVNGHLEDMDISVTAVQVRRCKWAPTVGAHVMFAPSHIIIYGVPPYFSCCVDYVTISKKRFIS